ncbi:ankyrin repeat domain-containing protein [Stenotrophomonas sp. SG1]|uniref:ankyrin repeat domain-containing protein n=1 Tax=Stenotrophomonas sp. SG1 TaxID=2944932 RepID=UPI0022437647|nr:ankyrin repeat domain-containing protein [Stenotrophomonas sp. SG1]MCW8340556.1 ankyrin repeat domain-containing protein [Stenotrophomonas sp. SG1]
MFGYNNLDMNNDKFRLSLMNDDSQYFKDLIRGGYDVNKQILDGDGELDCQGESTLLILAVENEAYSVIKVLVGAGADLEAQDHIGTALHNAAQQDDIVAVQLLLDAGADVNSMGPYGTPLHRTTCSECQEALISHGAEPKLKDADGLTVDQLNAVRAAVGDMNFANTVYMDLEELKSQMQREVLSSVVEEPVADGRVRTRRL